MDINIRQRHKQLQLLEKINNNLINQPKPTTP